MISPSDIRQAGEQAETEAYRFHKEKLYGIAAGLGSLAACRYRAADLLEGQIVSHRANTIAYWALLTAKGKTYGRRREDRANLAVNLLCFAAMLYLASHVFVWWLQ